MSYIKVIADEEEMKWFYKYVLPPLLPNEIYFVSMSIRKKKLDPEQRKIIPHNEMWNKQQIRHQSWESFIKHIRRLEVRIDSYFPFESESFINNATVCYVNICPVDCYSAMKDQLNHLTEIMSSLTDSAIKNSKMGLEQSYYKIRKSFDTCQSLFARNFGSRHWIDFDIDADNIEEAYGDIWKYFGAKFGFGNTVFVRTAGGMHCLVRRSVYIGDPKQLCEKVQQFIPWAKEIVHNKNEMIPLPGSFQYNTPVKVLNKKDFNESHIMDPEIFSVSSLMTEKYSKIGD
jgi:hypothetical protein